MKILKFGAVWCKECLVMKPMWAEIEAEIPEMETEYYDADDDPEIIKKYNAKKVPIFIFLDKNDREILRLQGIQDKKELIKLIEDNLDK